MHRHKNIASFSELWLSCELDRLHEFILRSRFRTRPNQNGSLSLSLYNFRIEQMHRIDFECVNKHCVCSRIARVFGAQQCDVRCDMLHGWSCESHVAKQNSVSHNHFPFTSSLGLLSRNLCNAKVAMWRNASS